MLLWSEPDSRPTSSRPGLRQVEQGWTRELGSKEAVSRDKTWHPLPLTSLHLGPRAGHCPVNWPGCSTTNLLGAWILVMLEVGSVLGTRQPKTPVVDLLSGREGAPRGGLVRSESA